MYGEKRKDFSRAKCAYCGKVRYTDKLKQIEGYSFCNTQGGWYGESHICHTKEDVIEFLKVIEQIKKLKVMRKHIRY